ncbi:type IV pilin protein [Planctomonas psychrotolerans]|uniref:type IV pilin protein n=1 Tax=Planctomonas psychrotolerans TaxID=2528712 RepID=UPI001D0D7BDB|nr:prepilin-type N-terminal cleavage/methylation domain-containing protein [Planctomonas psychrotolerans]
MIRFSDALTARRDALKNDDKGFTLIELLVVVLIIGVLAAIAIPIFLGQQTAAKESAAQSDVSSAKTAVIAQLVTGAAVPTGVLTASSLDGFAPSGKVTVEVTVPAGGIKDGFCIDAIHTETSQSYGATDDSGVAKGTCAAGVFTP